MCGLLPKPPVRYFCALQAAQRVAIGPVAVFAASGNTPLACTLMGVELFGSGILIYLAVGCFIAYLASGHRGIYVTQPVSTPKIAGADVEAGESLEHLVAAN